jgi:hypothetical protein
MLKLYQMRHPRTNTNASATYGSMAVVSLIKLAHLCWGNVYFQAGFTVIHLVTCLALSAQMYYMGRLKLGE